MWLNALACHGAPFLEEQRSPGPPATPSSPAQPSHHLSSDGLLAGPADPFGDRSNPQFVQVRLQAPQHAV